MAIIKWQETFNTGIARFDNEHKRIVELIDDLYDAVKSEKSDVDLRDLIDELVSYSHYHFTNEEEYMKMHKYPDIKEQVREHVRFNKKMKELQDKLQDDTPGLAREIYTFLRQWFQGHILNVDSKYGTFFKEKGVE